MTEVPEHLLKRSRERRSAMGGGGGDAGGESGAADSESTAATPATTDAPVPAAAAAAPAVVAEAAPPPPPAPHVQAALQRRRVPYWVMPVLLFLPVWAYLFQGTLEPPSAGEGDPLVLGEELFGENCASCHGGSGGGGVGPAFTDGALYETWPDWKDHFRWVRLGSTEWQAEEGPTYGAQEKTVAGGMPGFADFTDAELLLIINFERSLAGEPADVDAEADLQALILLAAENPDATLAELVEEAGLEVAIEGPGAPAES